MRISGECAMHQLHWNPLDSNSREDTAVVGCKYARYVAQDFWRTKNILLLSTGLSWQCGNGTYNTMRQVHHILGHSVFVDTGNTIIRVWRQGRYVAQVRYGCFILPPESRYLWERRAPHASSTSRKRQKLLVAASTTSTRILLFLLLPCQATLPADVNLFTSFVYYDPAATGWQTVKQEAEPRSLGRWAENIDRR